MTYQNKRIPSLQRTKVVAVLREGTGNVRCNWQIPCIKGLLGDAGKKKINRLIIFIDIFSHKLETFSSDGLYLRNNINKELSRGIYFWEFLELHNWTFLIIEKGNVGICSFFS